MTYSIDFRRHVLSVKEKENLTFQQTAERFCIPIRNLFRWIQRIEPKKTHNRLPRKIDMEALKRDVELHPDALSQERAQRFGVSSSGILKALKRLGITRKKKQPTSQSRRNYTYSVSRKDKVL